MQWTSAGPGIPHFDHFGAEHNPQLGEMGVGPTELRQFRRGALQRRTERERPQIRLPGLLCLALEFQDVTELQIRVRHARIKRQRSSVGDFRLHQHVGVPQLA